MKRVELERNGLTMHSCAVCSILHSTQNVCLCGVCDRIHVYRPFNNYLNVLNYSDSVYILINRIYDHVTAKQTAQEQTTIIAMPFQLKFDFHCVSIRFQHSKLPFHFHCFMFSVIFCNFLYVCSNVELNLCGTNDSHSKELKKISQQIYLL